MSWVLAAADPLGAAAGYGPTRPAGRAALLPPTRATPLRLPCAEQRHLQLLYRRCRTPDDLDKALKLTRLNYLARGELQQHKPFSHKTSQILIHVRRRSRSRRRGQAGEPGWRACSRQPLSPPSRPPAPSPAARCAASAQRGRA